MEFGSVVADAHLALPKGEEVFTEIVLPIVQCKFLNEGIYEVNSLRSGGNDGGVWSPMLDGDFA